MSTATEKASLAWRNEVFNSAPRIDVHATGKSTTRHEVNISWCGRREWVNGGHERIAALILEYLWTLDYVRRWKPQPITLTELGGPSYTPDFLVELATGELVVIEVKAKRFISPEVQQKFDLEKEFLEPLGFGFVLWTNADVLSSATSHTVSELERVRRFPATKNVIEEIRVATQHANTIGDLLESHSWDDVISAVEQQIFYISITEPVHEKTPIHLNHSIGQYSHLFARRADPVGWWDSLENLAPG